MIRTGSRDCIKLVKWHKTGAHQLTVCIGRDTLDRPRCSSASAQGVGGFEFVRDSVAQNQAGLGSVGDEMAGERVAGHGG